MTMYLVHFEDTIWETSANFVVYSYDELSAVSIARGNKDMRNWDYTYTLICIRSFE